MSGDRVVVEISRAPAADVDKLAAFGVSTVHEALGRRGFVGPSLRPIWAGARIAGTAVTVACAPGDNLMAHVAVEQTRPGDVLVVVPSSPCSDGYFGDLFATSLAARGVRALITETGVRDIAELTAMRFPVWSRHVSAQGTVKRSGGSVNVPVRLAGQLVHPGDVIVADDDGVLCVPRNETTLAIEASAARVEREDLMRRRLSRGELSLDIHNLRPLIDDLGVLYVRGPSGGGSP